MLREFACELCCQPKVADQLATNPTRQNYAAKKALETAVAFEAAATALNTDDLRDSLIAARAKAFLTALFARHFQPGMQVSPENLVKRAIALASSVEACVDCAIKDHEEAQAAAEEAEEAAAIAEAAEAEKQAEEAQAKAEAARKRAGARAEKSETKKDVGKPTKPSKPEPTEPEEAEPLTLEELKAMPVADLSIDAVTKSRLVTNELRTVGEVLAFRKSRQITDVEGIGNERAEKLDAALTALQSRVR